MPSRSAGHSTTCGGNWCWRRGESGATRQLDKPTTTLLLRLDGDSPDRGADMRLTRVLFPILCAAGIVGCQQAAPPAPPAAPPSPSPQAYGSLAEVMRSIPFPSSNIIFDTQTDDPAARKKSDEPRKTGTSTTSTYASVYGG